MTPAPAGAPHGAAVIDMRDVTRRLRYGPATTAVTAVDALTLSIPVGQTVALLGSSDSGTSAVLNLIAAYDRPDAGSISVDGVRVDTLSRRAAAHFRRRIGTVSQDSVLMAALTVIDNVVFPLLYQRVTFDRRERARELLDAIGLGRHAQARVPDLSAGQRRQVVIARALANRPLLMLANEPAAGLDREAGGEVLDLLTRMTGRYGMTLLLATHDDAVAARCRRVIRLRNGGLVSDELAPGDHRATRRWIERSAPLL